MKQVQELNETSKTLNFDGYSTDQMFDEMFESDEQPRKHHQALKGFLESLETEEFESMRNSAEQSLLRQGITFTVYNDDEGTEKIFPVDLIPRIITESEWQPVEKGLKQRIVALNQFVHDVYHDQKIIKDKVIPEEFVLGCKHFRPEIKGMNIPKDIYIHICGSDLVRDGDGQYYVLEDNARSPSGVSYMLENRLLLKKVLPGLFAEYSVSSIASYPKNLLQALKHIAPYDNDDAVVAVLTPGSFNSAYYEHCFLAREMGIQIVEGRDLVVENNCVYMRTIHGLKRVDVLYRRIDDDFLDPRVFRKDSVLGVPGLVEAHFKGNLGLANGIGTGVCDDKLIYTFVPDMIKYYLDEDPILPNVDTFLASNKSELDHILENCDKLVVKPVNESGGYGIVIGPKSTKREIDECKELVRSNPRNYIAQPPLSLSRHPTYCDGVFEGRHVDLRPYILYGDEITVTKGGLTRVALKKGSLIVNSSQGGGSKDTWVVSEPSFVNR